MELQKLERQRIRIYKQQLKDQMDKKNHLRMEENTYQRKRQSKDINQLIDRLNNDDIRRLEQRKNTQLLLKQHNEEMSVLKRSGLGFQDQGSKGNSFTDNISNRDLERIYKQRQEIRNQKDLNKMQGNMRKKYEGQIMKNQRDSEIKHVRRVLQMEQESRRNYQEIKRKHAQNMRLYDKHSQLMHENDQYKKVAQKFTDVKDDILSHLHRDQYTKRMNDNRFTQQVLKNQMEEFKEKKSMEKSHILEGHQLQKSIFRALLHDNPHNKKAYAEELKSQMSEADDRKSSQIKNLKQKFEIHGVFGGQHGRDRKYQIQYIDRKLGFSNKNQKNNNKNGSKVNRSLSKNKIKTSYHDIENTEDSKKEQKNEQKPQSIIPPTHQSHGINNQSKFTDEQLRKFQKRYEEEMREKEKMKYMNYRQEKQKQRSNRDSLQKDREKMSQSMHLKDIQGPIEGSPRYQSKEAPHLPRHNSHYEGYQLNQNRDKGNKIQYQSPQQAAPYLNHKQENYMQRNPLQPAEKVPGIADPSLYAQNMQNPQNQKVFRSFDLVTGRSKYYG